MVLTIENLSKNYGEKTLFSNVSLNINEGDKIGIVGINGTGKTTFLKTIAGRLEPDTGTMTKMRNLRISYLEQSKQYNPENTVLTEAFKDQTPLMQALRNYELALARTQAGDTSKETQQKLLTSSAQIDHLNAWNIENQAKNILTHLGITQFEAKISTLSAGQQKRLALATALIQPCDLLLLDEPTNHLDSNTICWLEDHLSHTKAAILIITHDRYFLDHITNNILEFSKGHNHTYTGNYTTYLEQKAARLEQEEASERKRQNFLRNELAWIKRGAQARSTKQKARIQRYEEIRNQKTDQTKTQLEISLAGSRLGRKIIEIDKLNYTQNNIPIINNLTYTVLRNDRIGILGNNATGKTTLLNLIAGHLNPTSGTITIGQTVKLGYLTQTTQEADPRLRAIEYIRQTANHITLADGTKQSASQLMERFLFPPDLQYTPISKLSGGEKRRLHLLHILINEPNILLLDEPTNDLDLETIAILENFLENFNGAIIFISHDRFFTDRMAKKIFHLDGSGQIHHHTGNYTDYQQHQTQQEAQHHAENTKTSRQTPNTKNEPISTKPQPQKKKKGLTLGEQKEYNEIEAKIASKEGELKAIQQQMTQQATNYTKLQELTREETRCTTELEKLMDRWTYLEETANP